MAYVIALNVETRDAVETYPTVPKPITVDWTGVPINCGTVDPLIVDMLSARVERIGAWTREAERKLVDPVKAVGTAKPLMVETTSWDVQTAPEAVRRPVLIWRDEIDVVMISPILMKPLLEPIARESTTREEM